ncbi:DDE-type integrase/transposase/recombinase [Candidatus Nomurabacteria bacterium]|nr:DDE-type integrase/transposase/recombinase [Candidatus Nomurabacteria bacterium]
MQIFNKFKGTKGFLSMYERVIRFRYMITEQAKQRTKILAFWERYGLPATKEAFGVSRPTLFRWQKELQESGGKLEALNKKSTAPKKRRKREIPEAIQNFIINERKFDPQLSKDKLSVLMRQDGVANLSSSTVGRMLNDLKKKGILPKYTKFSVSGKTGRLLERKPKKSRVKLRSKGHTGGLVKADSIVRFTNGIKRYIVTAIDKENKFAFAYAYKNHSSDSSTDFMKKFQSVAPLSLTHVQTDNGSEFASHFEMYLEKTGIVHFHTYPRCPKMNTEIERFNRTLSDAFIKQNRHLLAYDIDAFNQKLIDWLLWYNTRRPHWSLGLVSPMQYIVSTLSAKESHMLWTDTN